ncbi:MAG TPA: hypothetical protein DEV64_11925 [Rhodospirillaceae bacterium]|nr:hypothetical protein [Rhodospirillaceae bacterium]|tara:strand:- start:2560 stop:3030 length:471 start_codon:yes stop_codon:yes gene_type:complete
MGLKQHIRVFHVNLATLTILAFISGDFGVVQDILGYGVAAIIALRLLWVLLNPCQLCLNRFYPDFTWLRFGRWRRHLGVSQTLIFWITIALVGATATCLLIDRAAVTDDGFMYEMHEAFYNLVVVLFILHALCLLAFKRPLARLMLYHACTRQTDE